jgi:hypothetical protein
MIFGLSVLRRCRQLTTVGLRLLQKSVPSGGDVVVLCIVLTPQIRQGFLSEILEPPTIRERAIVVVDFWAFANFHTGNLSDSVGK